MAQKPLIPTDAEIAVVDRVYPGLAGLDSDVAGLVPAKVQESLKILADMGAVLESIRSEQPVRLEPYAEALVAVLRESGLSDEAAYDAISALFSSVAVARLLGDVAAGNLDPVAAVRKTKTTAPAKKTAAKKTAAKKTAAKPEPTAPAEPEPVVAAVVAVVEPVTEPAEVDPADEVLDESVDPNDFDLPIVEKPAPAAKKAAAKRPAAVPVPTSIGAGLLDQDPADDDF